MGSATALLTHLHELAASIGDDPDQLDQFLDAAIPDFRAAVPSFYGLQLTILQHHCPVVLTVLPTGPDHTAGPENTAGPNRSAAVTSLRLPFTMIGTGYEPGSQMILFAGNTGAFVDLAADLDYTFSQPSTPTAGDSTTADGKGHRPVVVLDADLPPGTTRSGLTGVDDYASISRAIGTMIETGHDPDEAETTLRIEAATMGIAPHQRARQLLHCAGPPATLNVTVNNA